MGVLPGVRGTTRVRAQGWRRPCRYLHLRSRDGEHAPTVVVLRGHEMSPEVVRDGARSGLIGTWKRPAQRCPSDVKQWHARLMRRRAAALYTARLGRRVLANTSCVLDAVRRRRARSAGSVDRCASGRWRVGEDADRSLPSHPLLPSLFSAAFLRGLPRRRRLCTPGHARSENATGRAGRTRAKAGWAWLRSWERPCADGGRTR